MMEMVIRGEDFEILWTLKYSRVLILNHGGALAFISSFLEVKRCHFFYFFPRRR